MEGAKAIITFPDHKYKSRLCFFTYGHKDSLTKEFEWILQATHDAYEIGGLAFLSTNDGFYKLLEVTRITKKEDQTNENPSINFKVPKLNRGDNLITILKIKSGTTALSENCEDLIKSIPKYD